MKIIWIIFEWIKAVINEIEPSSFYAEALVRGDITPLTAADHKFLGTKQPTDPYEEYGKQQAELLAPSEVEDLPMPVKGRPPLAFVSAVQEVLNRRRIAIMYAEGSFGPPNPKTTWPEMRIAAWREKVMLLLPLGSFSAPDDLDDWTYSHYPMAHPEAFDRFLMTRYPMIAGCYIKPEEIDEWKRLNPEYTTKLFTEWSKVPSNPNRVMQR